MTRILVLGANGMLGNAMIRVLSESADLQVYGTVRSDRAKQYFSPDIAAQLISGVDVEQPDLLLQALVRARPDVVINCVGLIKQLADAEDPLQAIPMNAILPHRLARMCELIGARMVHISTDCVFSGEKGGYLEFDPSDAKDLYGKSKFLGEVASPHTITLRTSIIGHELQSSNGLVGWFLSQKDRCNGYTKAIFSGLPTVELAQVVRDSVIPNEGMSGLFHVASQPISKYDLLNLIAEVYGKEIEIVPSEKVKIDRSLNATRFFTATGYSAPKWRELIEKMHKFK